jgi:predicted NAD/FAD-binding protein
VRIAIVGAGVSGLVAAHLLCDDHDVTVFEAADYAGGHVCTVDVVSDGKSYAVDTGFITFNTENYPGFTRLLARLGVATGPTRMSFSVRDERSGVEYCASNVAGLFARRGAWRSLSHLRFVRDLFRFSREARRLLSCSPAPEEPTLEAWLLKEGYGRELIERFAIPIGASIWSTSPAQVRTFPARFFIQFLENHRMLVWRGQPQWRVVRGGSRTYVERLIAGFREGLRLACPISRVQRTGPAVRLTLRDGSTETFDHVVLAVHSDQALRLLEQPTAAEREVLSAIRYQRNVAVLHTDQRLLPRNPRAQACWNYHLSAHDELPVALTYDMNRLQGLTARERFCVTLNRPDAIDPSKTLRTLTYHHPLFTPAAVAAQKRHHEISGTDRIHFCGAYWGYGFHEDGVQSALTVGRAFGKELP